MPVPTDRRYSPDHQWVQPDGDLFRVGLTEFAQEALGEITMVQLLKDPASAAIPAGAEMGEVEAFKAMTDLYMPVNARVVEFNNTLQDTPTAINSDPYGAGWICRISPISRADINELLDADGYSALIGAS